MEVATSRLRIVRLSTEAADAILHGERPAGADWAEGYPADSTLVAAGIVVTAAREGHDLGPWTIYQVIRAADGRVLAGLGFLGPPDADGAVHIGFSETREARAEGAVAEAVAALAAWAVKHPDVTMVRADTAVTNVRAVQVLEAAGMRRVHTDGALHHYVA